MSPMSQAFAGLALLLVFMLTLGAIAKVSEWFEKEEKNPKNIEEVGNKNIKEEKKEDL